MLAYMTEKWTDILSDIMAIYFISTGWMTLRANTAHSQLFIKAAFTVAVLLVFTNVAAEVIMTMTGTWRPDVPAGVGYVFATVLMIAAVGDFRLIRRGALNFKPRLARHLWRMCFALFIASASFAGQVNIFPEPVKESGVLVVVAVFPLITMVIWLLWLSSRRVMALVSRPAGLDVGSA